MIKPFVEKTLVRAIGISVFQLFFQLVAAVKRFPRPLGFSPYSIEIFRIVLVSAIKARSQLTSPSQSFTEGKLLEEDPDYLARECREKMGVVPVSFSWPGSRLSLGHEVNKELSKTIPGEPYFFDDFSEYLREYSSSRYGLTFKKGGWDVFRHLEIIFAGSIPLMPDINQTPKYTMIHYPKKGIEAAFLAWKNVSHLGADQIRKHIADWASSKLSSKSMAEYVIRHSGYSSGKLLFLDKNLPKVPDYLSVLTLIGLKQILGDDVEVAYPVKYIYQGFSEKEGELYGRGFGYTSILPPESMGLIERESFKGLVGSDLQSIDMLMGKFSNFIVGNFNDNRDAVEKLEAIDTGAKTLIYMRGDDLPPSRREYRSIRKLRGTVFSREIY